MPCDSGHVGAVRTPNIEENLPTAGSPSFSSLQHAMTTVTMATHHPAHKSTSGLEEMESEGKARFTADGKNNLILIRIILHFSFLIINVIFFLFSRC